MRYDREKTKKMILISIGCLLCAAVAIGIAARFGAKPRFLPVWYPMSRRKVATGCEYQQRRADGCGHPGGGAGRIGNRSRPGRRLSGLEQTIQADPVKPEQPQKPEAPDGTSTLPENHDAEDVPEEERRTEDEEPPT